MAERTVQILDWSEMVEKMAGLLQLNPGETAIVTVDMHLHANIGVMDRPDQALPHAVDRMAEQARHLPIDGGTRDRRPAKYRDL